MSALGFLCDHPEELHERLSPPRALERVGAALYAPPVRPAGRAWWAGATPGADLREAALAVLRRARSDGASALSVGGPPGNYRVSGLSPEDHALREILKDLGFQVQSTHCDLLAATSPPGPLSLSGEGEQETEIIGISPPLLTGRGGQGVRSLEWVAAHFGQPWRWEAERAFGHRGLFLAGPSSEPRGFVCHSGMNPSQGTFGPLGVLPAYRGTGLGARLARYCLADLARQGFDRVTVPWVARDTVGFYRKVCTVEQVLDREAWSLELDPA
ncbi:MAG: GNAT family N-acetyltransferase [Deltaproteobacteria bacterium]|nr:GNAT family N-acetyltransferase [Deltaproteobacteria bacterium]